MHIRCRSAPGCAHTLFVNSKFTANTFREAFPALAARDLIVLHPSINFAKYIEVYANKRAHF
jgi:hypothetical protein